MRTSLDEPALVRRFGTSKWLRFIGLSLLHAGPICWLSLCFQLGELYGKLERPIQGNKLRLLGRMWDVSFGEEPPPPPLLVRRAAREKWALVVLVPCTAVLLEWWLVTEAGASARIQSLCEYGLGRCG